MKPIQEIIPQSGIMLLLDRLVTADEKNTVAEYKPKPKQWYSDADGEMPAWIGLELMAQTVAAHVGEKKRRAGLSTKPGVLAGTRRYRAEVPRFSVGIVLSIHVTLVYEDESGLSAYDCNIQNDNSTLAKATLKVFEPNEFKTFLQESS